MKMNEYSKEIDAAAISQGLGLTAIPIAVFLLATVLRVAEPGLQSFAQVLIWSSALLVPLGLLRCWISDHSKNRTIVGLAFIFCLTSFCLAPFDGSVIDKIDGLVGMLGMFSVVFYAARFSRAVEQSGISRNLYFASGVIVTLGGLVTVMPDEPPIALMLLISVPLVLGVLWLPIAYCYNVGRLYARVAR